MRRARRGFTMVEVTVFAAVALIVMAGVWSFFSSSMKKSKATDVKLEGLQGAQLLARQLHKDLNYLYEDYSHPMKYKKVDGKGILFTFYRYHPDAGENPDSDWGTLPLQRIQYQYKADKRRVYRRVDAGKWRSVYGTFESMGFRDPWGKDPTGKGKLKPGPSLVYFLVCTPRRYLKMKLEERDKKSPRARTTIVGAVPRERMAARRKYFYWNRAPYWPTPPTKVTN